MTHHQVESFNATRADYPDHARIHELFEAHVRATPDAVALDCAGESLSYRELDRKANRVAHALREIGVAIDDRIAVCMARGPDMVAALLGVWKAGGAYVPLDPAYPQDRLSYMLEDSGAVAVVVDSQAQTPPHARPLPIVSMDAAAFAAWPDSDIAPLPGAGSRDLAYVIYTSGSTGRPKGVMVEHRGVANLLNSMRDMLDFRASDCLLNLTTIAFDISVLELFLPLITGARVALPAWRSAQDVERLVAAIENSGASVLQATPATWRMLLDAGWRGAPHLRALCGGEALSSELAERLTDRVGTLWNVYGPTETTIWSTAYRVEPSNDSRVHELIGKPIDNTRIYVLDEQRRHAPVGMVGELYIGGDGVARGYLNRDELMEERFLPDPFRAAADARMYRSGDLGRWLRDGNIEYLGRNDAQIKLRGFRIEPGEIEAALRSSEGIQDAVVVVRADSANEPALVAYYTGVEQDPADLRACLKTSLPDYMVPAALVNLARLPLTPNGKVDRNALPAPEAQAYARRGYEAPRGELEQTIAALWQELLGIERVGRQDDFFQLGGNSFTAMRLLAGIRRAGRALDASSLFERPTLQAVAAATVDAAQTPVPPNTIPAQCERITPQMLPLVALSQSELDSIAEAVPGGYGNIEDIYPLTPLQQGIFYHHLHSSAGRDPYVQCAVYEFADKDKLDTFVQTLGLAIDRHDVLRTCVAWQGLPSPVQVVQRKAVLEVEPFYPDDDRGDIAESMRAHFLSGAFFLDPCRAPMMQLHVAQDTTWGGWRAALVMHHLIGDALSLQALEAELTDGARTGEARPPVSPYRGHVARACAASDDPRHEAFFRQMLAGVEAPTLPYGLDDVLGDGSCIDEAVVEVDAALSLRLRSQARNLGLSVASVYHLAWALVVARLSGRDDVIFGTVLSGRLHDAGSSEQALGLFVNTLPLRLRMGADGARAGAQAAHAQLAALLRHEHAPLSMALRCSDIEASGPLFSALLNYRHIAASSLNTARDGVARLSFHERSNYPLVLSVDDLGTGFRLNAQAPARIDAGRICAYMLQALSVLADALENNPTEPLRNFSILPESERDRVLSKFNESPETSPQQPCIDRWVAQTAIRAPAATALEQDGRRMSYAELNARADSVAEQLHRLGIRADDRVAVCTSRGFAMVVAMLGVLKAGAAYVPLDRKLPADRLAYLLADASPLALLVDAASAGIFDSATVPRIRIDPSQTPLSTAAEPESANDPQRLAYVIYTSGSTGGPKGVMVEHRQLAHLAAWHQRAFDMRAGDRVSSIAGYGFDALAWELWPALCAGATVLLPPADLDSQDLEALLKWWSSQSIDVAFLPTPIAEYALNEGIAPRGLRVLLTGGDRLRQIPRRPLPFALVNNYGPTETTVVATSGQVFPSAGIPHIGKPVDHARVYVLDEQRQPVPVGVTGEVYIGGRGVARGYLHRDELNAERFLADPYAEALGARMYRTGDLGRWSNDGNLEFLGRNDHQIKMRGLRIEPGEIESALIACSGVTDAVVLLREDPAAEPFLVGYYTGTEHHIATLRDRLRSSLPDYMVPAALVRLESWPLTANGKLDRRALPAPGSEAYSTHAYQAPQGEIETSIAALWQELLGIERVGRHDEFLQLGGNSLSAMRLSAMLASAGFDVSIVELYRYPTTAALASFVEASGKDARSGAGRQRQMQVEESA